VIDRLLANGIDLTTTPVEVGPMAHYHMGGIRVDVNMQTRVDGLYAAGEAVGGANGANRLSGNAITEALVFGARAGAAAAEKVQREAVGWEESLAQESRRRLEQFRNNPQKDGATPVALQAELQRVMWEQVGPFRTGDRLAEALARVEQMRTKDLRRLRTGDTERFNLDLHEAFELRAMLLTAESVVRSALARTESRGAHQREDFPNTDAVCLKNQVVALQEGELIIRWVAPVRLNRSAANYE
jgi:succinate dehydrogenase/fumarate reductase flavoprotein subunit